MTLSDEEDDASVTSRIEALETHIEALQDKIMRSRRLAYVGRAAAVVGPMAVVALMFGVATYTPARMLAGLALLIGGIVLAGSSRSSTDELARRLARAERERDAAIDALGLVTAEAPTAPAAVLPWRPRRQ